MGIKGLTGLLSEHAPNSIKEHDIKTLFGRKVAIDASMSIYQFLIAVRQQDGQMLTNDAGETTSHLMGFFYRTIRMVEHGIKPAYVFDGKPPDLKSGVLSKRFEGRQKAKEDGEEAKEVGTTEDVDKFARRTVRVTREHNEECRRLLKLMGIPCIVVYAAGSEDMDTLTFNAPVLYRHLTFSEAKKAPISEIILEKALDGLGMSMEQFTELCILLGCDYLEPIKGVGPKNAFKLMQEHGSLKEVMKVLYAKMAEREEADLKKEKKAKAASAKKENKSKSEKEDEDEDEAMESEEEEKPVPKKENKAKSKKRIESDDEEAEDVDGLVQFLVVEKGFNEDRVRKGAEKLIKMLNTKQQGRLDGFFKVTESTSSKAKAAAGGKSGAGAKGAGAKRKADDKKDAGGKKVKTGGKK
ncbi:Elongation of fatty acids protein 2 [Ceratobasidium sp. 370]|nr:Elongation of fatty acids protein 2 [Ceratobasidium sp. 370]